MTAGRRMQFLLCEMEMPAHSRNYVAGEGEFMFHKTERRTGERNETNKTAYRIVDFNETQKRFDRRKQDAPAGRSITAETTGRFVP